MASRSFRLALFGLIAVLLSAPAFAQGGSTSSINGVVADGSGAAVPGATVVVTNTATSFEFTTYTSATGDFTVPSINIGTYTVTISLDGFKTVILNDVLLTAGGPATVRAILEVGGVEETVVVQASAEMVQTQSTTISSRIDVNEIANLPLSSRNVLDFVTQLPGVNTPGSNRNSTINGLTQSSINITLDGINVQDNTNKTGDGFFAIVNPRLDAVEEITVNAAAQGADSAGTGAVQIKFVTRSGSNSYTGSAYHYFRSDKLNANTWFNERDDVEKAALKQNQPGFRVGGPIVIPGLYDGHNQAFFFVNYEEFRQPSERTRLRTVLSPEAQAGLFRYNTAGGGVAGVDLLALAAANGQISTFDPIVQKLLADIRVAATSTGSISQLDDPNLQRFTFNNPTTSHNRFPTVRIDWNLSERHRLSGSLNYNSFSSFPDTLNNRDPFFPGFPSQGGQTSSRIGISTSLRSTLGANVVNELRVGGSGAPVSFFPEISPAQYSGSVANQGGFDLNISTANITDASGGATPSSRNAYIWQIENTLNWQRGNHGLNIGGSYQETRVWLKNQMMVPTLDFDIITGTSAKGLFSAANFPGSATGDRGDAEDLYAVLIGSVSNINGDARIDSATDEYVYLGPSLQEGKLPDVAFWIQDAWRPRPDLTINMGVRYELQRPFTALNNSYSSTTLDDVWGISGNLASCDQSNVNPVDCNIFKPGVTTSSARAEAQYGAFNKGTDLYNMDWNNLAPSVGAAWTPSTEGGGWLESFLGRPGDTVLRAGWSRSFQRNGMGDITGRLDDNPGLIIQDVDRNDGLGNLLAPGQNFLLLRNPSELGPAPFSLTRQFPLTDSQTQDVTWFDPNIQVPYADTWSAGWQRSLTNNMALEVRYVGTRSRQLWQNYNFNEINILENGVYNEFVLAQQNLQANIAAGRGSNFRYFGPGTGTSPLPIALAYFRGTPASQAGNAALYTSSNFASSTFVNELATFNPDPFGYANSLDAQTASRANALAAGLPANFLVVNPDKLGGAEITGNGGFTNYNSMQVELRRRMSNGFQFQANYAYGRGYLGDFHSFRVPWTRSLDTGSEGGVTQAIKFNWLYELPFGQGRRFASNVGPWMDRLVGGWQVHGLGRLQTGEILDFGNRRMVGFDIDDLKNMLETRVSSTGVVTFLPDDVIENSIRAFNVSATSATGYSALGVPEGRYFAPANGPDCVELIADSYGDCGARHIEVNSPWFKTIDLSIVKSVPVTGRVRAEFRIEMLNAFNVVNYDALEGVGGTTATSFQATGLVGATQARVIQLVSRVTW